MIRPLLRRMRTFVPCVELVRPPATDERLVIRVRSDLKMSRGKYAAQAVHAALLHLGVHPNTSVIVLGGKPQEVSGCATHVRDAGLNEVEPGTLTAGASWETGDPD